MNKLQEYKLQVTVTFPSSVTKEGDLKGNDSIMAVKTITARRWRKW